LRVFTRMNQSKADFDSHKCIGEAKYISQLITEIIVGDTIYTANYKIRLSLVDTPEIVMKEIVITTGCDAEYASHVFSVLKKMGLVLSRKHGV
jgi:endonuclease YncB( thermonuclease family)